MSDLTRLSASKTSIVLASSSPYRRQQLEDRLGLRCQAIAPNIDEARIGGEDPRQMALRLSLLKARRVCAMLDKDGALENSIVIAGDQTAQWRDQLLSKPGNHENAVKQLYGFAGEKVVFYSGICVISNEGLKVQTNVAISEVKFRRLTLAQVANYVEQDKPWDCVGAFKNEGLGIALFEAIRSEDPSALTGLPLISLCSMLQACGLEILA